MADTLKPHQARRVLRDILLSLGLRADVKIYYGREGVALKAPTRAVALLPEFIGPYPVLNYLS